MDNTKRIKKKNPASGANPLSKIFVWYTKEIFWKTNQRDVTMDDIYDPLKVDESERLANILEKEWNHEVEKQKQLEYKLNEAGKKVPAKKKIGPSLTKALMRMFFWQNALLSILWVMTFLVFQVSHPIFLGWVIDYFRMRDQTGEHLKNALIYATYMLLVKFFTVIFMHHAFQYALLMGMRARVACCALIYRKTLRLNKSVLDKTAAGQVVNLMSNDVSRLDQLFQYINFIWITPIQVILIVYLMWDQVGEMLLVGIAILLIIAIPLQSVVIYVSKILRSKIATLTDQRVQLMSELVSGIQVIKMYAWEKPFEKVVNSTRLAEMKKITTTSIVRSIFFSSMVYTERTTVFATIVLFVLMGNQLTAKTSFVLATYFNMLQMTIIYMMPSGLIGAGEASVSIKRISEFLLLDEIAKSKVEVDEKLPKQLTNKEVAIVKDADKIVSKKDVQQSTPVEINFQRVSANWIPNQLPPTLNELTFKIEAGELCALAGSVGSGKSAVLNLLLRELGLGAGRVTLKQKLGDDANGDVAQQLSGFHTDNPNLRISYASQEAWLFAGSVRDNILFGQAYDPARYAEVTEVCALRRDFEQLSKGDQTIVGERGSSLSGGQRARINLARAVYREADIYLLDDPLSAVDPRVARHLFDRCVRGYLSGKTRILVTHQLQFLRRADSIVFLDRGSVIYHGSYENVTNLNPKVMDMLGKLLSEDDKKKTTADALAENKENNDDADAKSVSSDVSSLKSVNISEGEAESSSDRTDDEENVPRVYGNWNLFVMYLKSGSSWFLIGFYILIAILTQLSTSATDSWLGYWTNVENERTLRNMEMNRSLTMGNAANNGTVGYREPTINADGTNVNNDDLLSTNDCIYIYTAVLVICAFTCLLRNYISTKLCMNASQNLHETMFSNLLRATMSFFNKNSSGRILNRFSKDIGAIDEILSRSFTEAVQIFSVMIGICFVIVVIDPWMLIPLFIVAVLFWLSQKIYLNAVEKIKGIETAAKSPVFAHVNASLNGLTTIRSCGGSIEKQLVKEFDQYQNDHSGTWFLNLTTGTAFAMFVDITLVAFNAVVAYSLILSHDANLESGNVGLALSQASVLSGMVQYGFRLFIDCISQMTSVERIIQYTNLPQEFPLTSPSPLPESWPNRGRVSFKFVSMRYEENQPYVLKKLNITIEGGWKVGIVGRTGAGKSSIIQALFRLTGDNLEGEIRIDSINTGSIGLQDLRTRISIIPQEPVLFTQTLRYNLDPFGQYDDAVLWDALREVELTELSLDQKIAEKGANLSVGQRQLICLARAIVRRNMILVLDEATANIDTHTDAIIQNTIRKRFAKCTVLTIAHRLNTIIDSDRIVVMDNGTIVEFGCPYELLKNVDGHFSQMVSQTGKVMSKRLEQLAEEACLRNNQQRSLDFCGDSSDSEETLPIESEAVYNVRL